MDEKNIEPSYWAVIPADVRYDPKLPPMARLLYAEISSLTHAAGYCFASNEHFMRLFDESERTLQRHLKALEAGGYIVIRNGDGGAGRRRIFAGVNPLAENPDKNDGVPNNPDKNDGVTPTKMTGSTLNNNKYNKPPVTPQGAASASRKKRRTKSVPEWEPDLFERFWKKYPRGDDRIGAADEWDRLKPDLELMRKMSAALDRQMKSDEWRRGIGIPYACRWLRKRRWEDDLTRGPSEDPEEAETFDEEDLPEWT